MAAMPLEDTKAKTFVDNIKDNLKNANHFDKDKGAGKSKGADQIPFSATGYILYDNPSYPTDPSMSMCVGSVIYNVDHAQPPPAHPFRATYVLTAGHCCDAGFRNFGFSWHVNSRVILDEIRWNLAEMFPHRVTGSNLHGGDEDRHDWCVIAFTGGAHVGRAPAVLHIKYDDESGLPDENKLLLSTYWTPEMKPPNPGLNDHLKKFAIVHARKHTDASGHILPGLWKLKKEYTAFGMSGAPLVETGHPNLIRATVQSGKHIDIICQIDEQEFNDIRTVVNDHITAALPHVAAAARPIMEPRRSGTGFSTAAAHHFTDDLLTPYFMDKDLEENSNGYGLGYDHHNSHLGTGHIDDGSMELVTNKYYYQYGEHGQDHMRSDNIYSFAMGAIMTIGICCFVMMISIMINFCACVANIYYTSTNNRHSKHGGNRYNIVDNDVDGDQV